MKKNTIKLKKYSDIRIEAIAHEAITPGMLVELRSDGKVQKHTGAGYKTLPMFAVEDELQGRTIDTAYASGELVQIWIAGRGDEVLALLKDNQKVAVADELMCDGSGAVEAATTAAHGDSVFAIALKAVDLSGTSGTYPETGHRIPIRIL